MKKKSIIALISVMLVSIFALTGCGGFSKISVSGTQDTEYTVFSNGGNAVQYGNYVYFISGTKGFDDDGKSNVWGNVTKGALYRAELRGSKNATDGSLFDIAVPSTEKAVTEFVTETKTYYVDPSTPVHPDDITKATEDEDEHGIVLEEKQEISAQLIAPKVIGTSGYKKGGIYIYDNYVYYATPNNTKNKSGTVQTSKTDFMRTKLDGSNTQLIYTTEGDSADQPYAFYKSGGNVYLVCSYKNSDDTYSIVSVKTSGDKKTKKKDRVYITSKATSVLLPTRSTYNKNETPVFGLEDFVFYTRAITKDDNVSTGNAVEICTPDGNNAINILMPNETVILESVSGSALFYRLKSATGTSKLWYNNFHDTLMENSNTYKDYENAVVDEKQKRTQEKNVIIDANLDSYNTLYCIRSSVYAGMASVIGFSDSEVRFFSNGANNYQILKESATLHFIEGNQMYFTLTDGTTLYSADINQVNETGTYSLVAENIITTGFNVDYAAGYVVYTASPDEFVTNGGYTFFKSVSSEGNDAVITALRDSGDYRRYDDIGADTEEETDTDESAE